MSSSIDKTFGDMFIHGVHPDGRCDLVWSSYSDELTLELVDYASARKMMEVWDKLKEETQRLRDREWMHEQVQG